MKKITKMLTCCALIFPLSGVAAPFEGFSIGGAAVAHSLVVDADFTGNPPSASGTGSELGAMLDVGFGGRPGSSNVYLQGGFRLYPVEIGTAVYSDDHVEVSDISVLYAHIGGIINNKNAVYGVIESGTADARLQQAGYEDVSGDIDVFGFGVGYRRSIDASAEFFVEGITRVYEEVSVTYVGGPLNGETTQYEGVGGSVAAGFTLRF